VVEVRTRSPTSSGFEFKSNMAHPHPDLIAGTTLGIVMDVAISSDGCMAATVSDDYTCRVWDLDEEECLHVMEGHNGWVTSVEFIGTSMELITASHDETARVWDGERGKCLRVLEGHEGRLNKVTVDIGGTYAVTCSDDLTSRVWEIDSGQCICILKGHEAWISDAAIMRGGSHVVTVSGDATAILWDARNGERPGIDRVFSRHTKQLCTDNHLVLTITLY
jgi:WD40 repeat protein